MRLNRNILLDLNEVIFLCLPNICSTSAGVEKKARSITMIFAGTNTNGHTDMIKPQNPTAPQCLDIALLLLLH